jgi:hypothetical protein
MKPFPNLPRSHSAALRTRADEAFAAIDQGFAKSETRVGPRPARWISRAGGSSLPGRHH